MIQDLEHLDNITGGKAAIALYNEAYDILGRQPADVGELITTLATSEKLMKHESKKDRRYGYNHADRKYLEDNFERITKEWSEEHKQKTI